MDSEDHDHFKTIASASRVPQRVSPTPPNAANSISARVPAAYCLNRAKMMFGCYRKDEAHDPETYVAAVAAVLSEYDRDTIDYVTDPRTGLPSSNKFLPNVAEIRDALENRAASTERDRTYQARVEEQLRLTEEWRAQTSSERLQKMGDEWLRRIDPVAQQLSKEKPKIVTDEQRNALIASAKSAAATINSGAVKLSDELRESIQEKDKHREELSGDLRE